MRWAHVDPQMNPLSSYPAIAALTVALSVTLLLLKRVGAPSVSGRVVAIDGLRGYLAFFVFLHHSAIWYFFVRTGHWGPPPSHLYTHLGYSSVALFFMITGFLFWTRLIDGRKTRINWLRLYVSRILRLTPLYVLMMLLLLLLTGVLSNFALRESPSMLLTELLRWSTFTILGAPEVNGVRGTSFLIGGPTWSLPYEWFFYLSLPASALLLRVIPPFIYLLVSAAGVVALVLWNPLLWHLAAFGGGIAAAFLVRWIPDSPLVHGRVGAIVALLCLAATVFDFPSPYTTTALVLLAIAFTIVACGNTLFGVLSAGASRALGEASYSIYLLHSIVLFVAFRFVVGYEKAASLSAIAHWLVVLCCTVVLIPVCFATFHFIEAPAMRAVPGVTAWIETRLSRRSERS